MSDEINILDAQIEELQQRKQSLLKNLRAEALTSTRAAVRQFGFTAQELGIAANTGTRPALSATSTAPRVAKYCNPANPLQTWPGGKGAKPKWVRAHLDAGGDLEDLLIERQIRPADSALL